MSPTLPQVITAGGAMFRANKFGTESGKLITILPFETYTRESI